MKEYKILADTVEVAYSTSEKDLKLIEQENCFAQSKIPAIFNLIVSASDSQEVHDVQQYKDKMRLPYAEGAQGGACTISAFLAAVHRNRKVRDDTMTWAEMLQTMRDSLSKMGMRDRTPNLLSSRVIDMNKPMRIVPDKCSGNKRALLIGINYVTEPIRKQLKTSHYDVNNMRDHLIKHEGFRERDIVILMDDMSHKLPTKKNIMNGFQKLAECSNPGDVVFIQFSGHSGQSLDWDGDESDGYDEIIFPCDYDRAGEIFDDDIYRELVQPMRSGVHCTILIDGSYFGTILDLPYEVDSKYFTMNLKEDFKDNRSYEDIIERIEFNDRTLNALILDDPTQYVEDRDWFLDLNTAIRKNFRIESVALLDNFLGAFKERKQNKLLKSIGCLQFLEKVIIADCKKLTLEQLKIMVSESSSLKTLQIKRCVFCNNSDESNEFIEYLSEHPSETDCIFDLCSFTAPKIIPKSDQLAKFRKAMNKNSQSSRRSLLEKSSKLSDRDLKVIEQENSYAQSKIPAIFNIISSAGNSQGSKVHDRSSMNLPKNMGMKGGNCTVALLTALHRDFGHRDDNLTWGQMLQKMHIALKYMTIENPMPQLSSSRMMDMNKRMRIVPQNCTGRKRALLIGINYVTEPSNRKLKACHEGIHNMKEYLIEHEGFKERDMLILLDDDSHELPTRKKIINGMKMLTERSQPDDVAFIQFLGHGGQLFGDESDGYDEVFFPCNYDQAGHISEADIYRFLVKPMEADVHCTVLMDLCHLGTLLDLPYKCDHEHLKMDLQEDFNDKRVYEDIIERIEFNDRTLTELILDDANEYIDLPNWFHDLNVALRKNCRIGDVSLLNYFLDSFSENKQKKLLKSIGCLEFLENIIITDCKTLSFEKVKMMISNSSSLKTIKFKSCEFDNNDGSDLKEFVEYLREHPSVLQYSFDLCTFTDATENSRKDEISKQKKANAIDDDFSSSNSRSKADYKAAKSKRKSIAQRQSNDSASCNYSTGKNNSNQARKTKNRRYHDDYSSDEETFGSTASESTSGIRSFLERLKISRKSRKANKKREINDDNESYTSNRSNEYRKAKSRKSKNRDDEYSLDSSKSNRSLKHKKKKHMSSPISDDDESYTSNRSNEYRKAKSRKSKNRDDEYSLGSSRSNRSLKQKKKKHMSSPLSDDDESYTSNRSNQYRRSKSRKSRNRDDEYSLNSSRSSKLLKHKKKKHMSSPLSDDDESYTSNRSNQYRKAKSRKSKNRDDEYSPDSSRSKKSLKQKKKKYMSSPLSDDDESYTSNRSNGSRKPKSRKSKNRDDDYSLDSSRSNISLKQKKKKHMSSPFSDEDESYTSNRSNGSRKPKSRKSKNIDDEYSLDSSRSSKSLNQKKKKYMSSPLSDDDESYTSNRSNGSRRSKSRKSKNRDDEYSIDSSRSSKSLKLKKKKHMSSPLSDEDNSRGSSYSRKSQKSNFDDSYGSFSESSSVALKSIRKSKRKKNAKSSRKQRD